MLPNFLVIGAAKCGTSALYEYLAQHPDVFMSPVKEPNYFVLGGHPADWRGPGGSPAPMNRNSVHDRAAYEELFERGRGRAAIGEASTVYLYDPRAPEAIRKAIPHARLIVMLRDPAERAYSSYFHLLREDREPAGDFRAALELEEQRLRENWGILWRYRDAGRYATQLERYLALFPREQLHFILYEDFARDPAAVAAGVFRYLGVRDDARIETGTRYNVSGVPRNRLVHALLGSRNPLKAALKPFVPPAVRRRWIARARSANLMKPRKDPAIIAELRASFVDEADRLPAILGRELDWASTVHR